VTWREFLRRRFWLLYPAWILICGLLFLSLRPFYQGPRVNGRLTSDQASERALEILRSNDDKRFATYDAVHSAYARDGEAGPGPRWIVLCDHPDRSALREAVVVELEANTGNLIKIRPPVSRVQRSGGS